MRTICSRFAATALFTLTFLMPISAQTPFEEAPRRTDLPAAWPGCDARMSDCTRSRLADFIAANLQIPPEAKAEGTGGLVMVEFVIEKNGTLGEIRAVKDPGKGLGAEAVRVIKLMKDRKMKWTPAEEDGKRVPFRYTVPVSFNLASPPKEKPAPAPQAEDQAGVIYDAAEIMPRLSGCPAVDTTNCTYRQLLQHIKDNMKYPEEAIANQVQGQVITEFVIDPTGHITQAKVKSGIGGGCDEEAIRVLSLLPQWEPGMQDGKPVPVRMVVPFLFQLPKPADKE